MHLNMDLSGNSCLIQGAWHIANQQVKEEQELEESPQVSPTFDAAFFKELAKISPLNSPHPSSSDSDNFDFSAWSESPCAVATRTSQDLQQQQQQQQQQQPQTQQQQQRQMCLANESYDNFATGYLNCQQISDNAGYSADQTASNNKYVYNPTTGMIGLYDASGELLSYTPAVPMQPPGESREPPQAHQRPNLPPYPLSPPPYSMATSGVYSTVRSSSARFIPPAHQNTHQNTHLSNTHQNTHLSNIHQNTHHQNTQQSQYFGPEHGALPGNTSDGHSPLSPAESFNGFPDILVGSPSEERSPESHTTKGECHVCVSEMI